MQIDNRKSTTKEDYYASIDVIKANRATTAKVHIYFSDLNEFITGSGEAIRMLHDDDEPEVGTTLAVGRALQNAGYKMEKRGLGLERMLVHNRQKSRFARTSKALAKKKKYKKKLKSKK